MRWMPRIPRRGNQKKLRTSQLVSGSVSGVYRRPASTTPTR